MKISVVSKLDGIRSWSLQALETCPGAYAKPPKKVPGMNYKTELVDACSGCYALQGNYVFGNVKAARAHNLEDWQLDDWEDRMVAELVNDEHFRWLDSGDMYKLRLAYKIYNVMRRTPWCEHWLPTRMHKFAAYAAILRAMQALPNVMVRPSSDYVDGRFTAGVHGSTIIPADMPTPEGAKRCEAYEHDGKCSGCRACWDKTVPVIAYTAHGMKMKKVIRLLQSNA